MAKTAVGLFENSGLADEVVRDLVASGFLRNDVRVLSEPREMAGSGLMSTPHTDFEVALTRDLTAFGVLEADAEAYVQGVRARRSHGFRNRFGRKGERGYRDYEPSRCCRVRRDQRPAAGTPNIGPM